MKWIGSPNFTKGRGGKKPELNILPESISLPSSPGPMDCVMLGYGYCQKVLRAVVQFITVQVVRSLSWQKLTAEFLFQNNDMDKLTTGVISEVSPGSDVGSTLPDSFSMTRPTSFGIKGFFRGTAVTAGFHTTIVPERGRL